MTLRTEYICDECGGRFASLNQAMGHTCQVEEEKPEPEKPNMGQLLNQAKSMVRKRIEDLEERQSVLMKMDDGPLGYPYTQFHEGLYAAAREEKEHWERMLPIIEKEPQKEHEKPKESTRTETQPPVPVANEDGIYIGRGRVRSITMQDKEGKKVQLQHDVNGKGYLEKAPEKGADRGAFTNPRVTLAKAASMLNKGFVLTGCDLERGMEEPYFQTTDLGDLYKSVEDALKKGEDQ